MASKLKRAIEKLFDKAGRGPTYTGSLHPQGNRPVQNIKTGMGGPLMQGYGGSAQAGPASPANASPSAMASALRARPPAPPVPPEAQAQVRVPNFGHELPPGMTGQELPGTPIAGVGVGDDLEVGYTDVPNPVMRRVKAPGGPMMHYGPGTQPGPHSDDIGFHDEELEPVTPLGEGGQELPYETMLAGDEDQAMQDKMIHSVVQDPKLMQMLIRMLRSRSSGNAQPDY